MQAANYKDRRERLTTYFDQTAAEAWSRLTSDAPVGRVRATVRAGRDAMRDTLLEWLPDDLHGARVLDAGCGTGAFSIEAAGRGAQVTAVDVSASLVELAQKRTPAGVRQQIDYRVGDMLSNQHGEFDYVVAMDSMIHYPAIEIVDMLGVLARRTRRGLLFTFAPRTPALTVMHAVGRLIPYSEHRAPAIEPVAESHLLELVASEPSLDRWRCGASRRISSAFYKSHAMMLERP